MPRFDPERGPFGAFVAAQARGGRLVVQPRMGFSNFGAMRQGLVAVRNADAATVGTVTLDSFTRVNAHASARAAVDAGEDLNGYPIVAYGPEKTRQLVAGIASPEFPIQVRHGSALPVEIFEALLAAGLRTTEGGPISYCLPYSRVPVRQAVAAWERCCRLFADASADGHLCHLESFGGCMLGQLCPPSLLVAISILEGLFFTRLGVASVSVSYAQQTHLRQDLEAVAALRQLASEYLGEIDWHVVIYTYMGLFPATGEGAQRILDESIELAALSGSERLIVKTPAEAHRIPTIDENVASLEAAARAAERIAVEGRAARARNSDQTYGIYSQAKFLVEMVLDLNRDLGAGLSVAFENGYLDVPYCLHPDNANRARSFIDEEGALQWSTLGRIPLPPALVPEPSSLDSVSARGLLRMLSYNQRRFDNALTAGPTTPLLGRSA